MEPPYAAPILPTVSRAFLQDWLDALALHCAAQPLTAFLSRIGLAQGAHPQARVTHDQIVRLYQWVAAQTGDEMMGLWSRPIRSGALKHLCTSVRGASSLSAALFRFASFWNLMLDDFELVLEDDGDLIQLSLLPRGNAPPNRFGHMLLLKLVHGIASWLTGRELGLRAVGFAFDRPAFAQDYAILFPVQVGFGQIRSAIAFDASLGHLSVGRSDAEMLTFLSRAPRDWIFTTYREHALPLRIRDLLLSSERMAYHLEDAAQALHMTPRTLIRRLDGDGTSFQTIKDGVRRDIAMRDLAFGKKTIEAISHEIGFASAANFHRAFKTWTGATPGAYRRASTGRV